MRRFFKKTTASILAAAMILSQNGVMTFAQESVVEDAVKAKSYQSVIEKEIKDIEEEDTKKSENVTKSDEKTLDKSKNETDSETEVSEEDSSVEANEFAAEIPYGYVLGYDAAGNFKYYCAEDSTFKGSHPGYEGYAYVASYTRTDNPGSAKSPVQIPDECTDSEGKKYLATGIYSDAFAKSTTIKYVQLPDSIKTIGDRAFANSSINNVVVAEDGSPSLEYIGANAFKGSKLGEGLDTTKYFKIPATVKRIGAGAFKDCTSLKQVALPDGEFSFDINEDTYEEKAVLTDEERAEKSADTFAGCSALVRVNYGDSTRVKILPGSVFANCINLQKISLESDTKSAQGINFDVNDDGKIGVEYIGYRCFYNCQKIASFTASDTLKYIGKQAFMPNIDSESKVSVLKSVKLDNATGLLTIGQEAFRGAPLGTSSSQRGTVTIPGTILSIGYKAFSECENLGTVVFESKDGVVVSENKLVLEAPAEKSYTFANCKNLKKVTLPKHLVSVPAYTFENCESLSDCDYDSFDILPAEGGSVLEEIGTNAFAGCVSLKEFKAPASLITIGESAYENCKALTWVDLEYSINLETIKKRAFANAGIGNGRSGSKSTVYISARMKNIGQEAFLNCSNLTAILLNNDVAKTPFNYYTPLTIGKSAFEGCTELEQVEVGRLADNLYKKNGAVTPLGPESNYNEYAIGDRAFYKDDKLESFYSVFHDYGVEDKVEQYFNGDMEAEYAEAEASNISDFLLSDEITRKSILFTVGESAFEGCTSLMYAPFVASPALKEIKNLAFNDCIALELFEDSVAREKYKYGDSKVLTYDDGPYYYDDNGDKVIFAGAANTAVRRIGSNNLVSIGYKAFNNTAIGKSILDENDKDKEVRRLKLYGSPEIGYNAFSNTSALAYLDIMGAPVFKEQSTTDDIKGSTFEKAAELKDVIIHEGTKELSSYMFSECTKLERVKYPKSLKKIGKAAFYKCSSLGGFNKDENLEKLESIGDYAFAFCTNLEEVYFTDCNKLTSIGKAAFLNAPCGSSKNMGNRKLIIPCTVESIGESAFENAKYLEEVYFDNMADGVTPAEKMVFGKRCFRGCSKLVTMYLPTRCTVVPEEFMYDCKVLTTFYVPQNVTKFEKNAVTAGAIKKICTVYGDVAKCAAADFASKNGLKYSYDLSKLPIFAQEIALSVFMYEDVDGELMNTDHLGTYFIQLNDGITPTGEVDESYQYVGKKIRIKSTVLPQTVENKDVIYYSSNESVAVVNNNGVAEIVGYGTTRIYAISKSKSGVASGTTVTVKGMLPQAKIDQYTKDIKSMCGDFTQLVRNVCANTDNYSLDDVNISSSELGNNVKARWTETYPIIGDGQKRNTVTYDGTKKNYMITLESEKYGDIETGPYVIKAHTITGAYLWPGNYEGIDSAKYIENNTIATNKTVYYDVYVTTTEKKYDAKARFGGGIKLSELLDEDTQYVWEVTNSNPKALSVAKYRKRPGVVEVKASSAAKNITIGVNLKFKHQKKTFVYDNTTLGTTWVTGTTVLNSINALVVNRIDIKTQPSPIGPDEILFENEEGELSPYTTDEGIIVCADVFKYADAKGAPKDAIYKVDAYAYANEFVKNLDDDSVSANNVQAKNVPADIKWSVNDSKMASVKSVKGQLYLTIKKKAVGEFILTATASKNGGYSRNIKVRVLDDAVLAPRLSTAEVSINSNYDHDARPTVDGYEDADSRSGYQYADIEFSIPDYLRNKGLEPGQGLEVKNLHLANAKEIGSNRYELKYATLGNDELDKIITVGDNEKKVYKVRIIVKDGKIPASTEKLYIWGNYEWDRNGDNTVDPVNESFEFKSEIISIKGVKTTPTITFTQEVSDYVKLYSPELGGNVLIRSNEEIKSIEYESKATSDKPSLTGQTVYASPETPMYETSYHLQMVRDTEANYKQTVLKGTFKFKFKKYSDYALYKKDYTAKAAKEPNGIKVTLDNSKLAPLTDIDTAHLIITDAVTGDRITDSGLYFKKTAKDGEIYYVKDNNSDDYTITIGTYYKDPKTKLVTKEDPHFEINPPVTTTDPYKVDDYTVKALEKTEENGGYVVVKVSGSWRDGITTQAECQITTVEDEGPLGIEKKKDILNVNSDSRYNKNDKLNPSNEINSVETKIFVPGFENDEIAKRIDPSEFNITGADLISKQQIDFGRIIVNTIWPSEYVEYCKTMNYRTYGVPGVDPKATDDIEDPHVYKNPIVRITVKPGVYSEEKTFKFKVSAKMDESDEFESGKKITLSTDYTVTIHPNKFDVKPITFGGIKFNAITESDIEANRMAMVFTQSGTINVLERNNTYMTVKADLKRTSLIATDAHLVGGYANLFESKYDADKKELYIKATKGDDIKYGSIYRLYVEADLKNGTKITTGRIPVTPKQAATTVSLDKKSVRLYAGSTGIEAGTDVIVIPNNGRIVVSPFYPEKAVHAGNVSDLEEQEVVINEEYDEATGTMDVETAMVRVDDLGRLFIYRDADGVLHGEVGLDENNDGYVDEGSIDGAEDPEYGVLPIYNPRKKTYTDANFAIEEVECAARADRSMYIMVPYDGNEYYIDDYKVVNPWNSSDTFTFKAGSKVKESDKEVPGYDESTANKYIAALAKYDPMDIDDKDYVQGRRGAVKYRVFIKPNSKAKIGSYSPLLRVRFVDSDENVTLSTIKLPMTILK